MAETADKLGLIKGISSHFHPAHRLHVLVHFQELILFHLNLKRWSLASICAEGLLMKFYSKRF